MIFAVVFAGLLWPTFLMGCSLPFLSKAVVSEIAGSAKLIGWLYGLNTLGAGVGAFVGGWYLIGTFGFDKAVYVGAALNLVVAVGGLLLARGLGMAETKAPRRRGACEESDGGVVWRWSLLVFISGFLIVALQIVWYRLIGVLLQSNGYSFSLVLSVFLLGDAAGLLVGARTIDRIADPRRFFFLMQGIATALALAGAWFVYWAIGAGMLPATFVDRDIMSGRPADTALIVLLLLIVVLPASFIMGFSFPVVQKAVQRDIDRLGQRVGLVQLANIVGNSAGSLVAGLLLLDLVGTAGTLKLLVAIGLGFAGPADRHARRRRAGSIRPPSCWSLGLVFFPPDHDFWRRLHGITTEQAIVAEDKTGLSLLKMADEQDGKLYIQGHSQSRLPFDTVHVFLGAIGPLTHPAPKRVLVIGSGTGGTPYAAGLHPGTERVRVIEIVAPVIDTLRRYLDRKGRSGVDSLLTNPKFEIVVADGRHALALDPTRYDVIEADAILPKTALSGLLNSQEFFRQVTVEAGAGRHLRAVGADRAHHRDLPLGLPLRHHGPSGAAGQRPADPAIAREDPGTAGAAGDRHPSDVGAHRSRRAAEMVRGQEDRGAERRQDGAGDLAQHRLLSARRVLPQSSLMSRATSGRRSSWPMRSASSKVRSTSKRISGA